MAPLSVSTSVVAVPATALSALLVRRFSYPRISNCVYAYELICRVCCFSRRVPKPPLSLALHHHLRLQATAFTPTITPFLHTIGPRQRRLLQGTPQHLQAHLQIIRRSVMMDIRLPQHRSLFSTLLAHLYRCPGSTFGQPLLMGH